MAKSLPSLLSKTNSRYTTIKLKHETIKILEEKNYLINFEIQEGGSSIYLTPIQVGLDHPHVVT